MSAKKTPQRAILLLAMLIGLLSLWGLMLPVSGQGLFATNTVPAPLFATNTPVAAGNPESVAPLATPSAGPPVPDAPLVNYALRQWFEADMLSFIRTQVEALQAGDAEAARALQISLFELAQRFPAAPRDPAERQELLMAMLAAPPGSIDMRLIVRPFIEAALNRQGGSTASFSVEGFEVMLRTANFNNDGQPDLLLHVTYPVQDGELASLLYGEYLMALGSANGSYRLLDTDYDLPAVPFGGIESVSLYQLADVNRDGQDNVVLQVTDGQVNQRLFILGFRNQAAVELSAPSQEIRFGEILSWPFDNPDAQSPALSLQQYRVVTAAPNWPCVSQAPVSWSYSSNFYRATVPDAASFVDQDSLGCILYRSEPFFALEPGQAISAIEEALNRFSLSTPGAERAILTLAMLNVLQGRVEEARSLASSVRPVGDSIDNWTSQQADALQEALSIANNTGLDVCEALVQASPEPACDMDAVLGRYFGIVDLRTDTDLTSQLISLGFPVAESVRVSQVGRADRIVVSFDLAGSGWWGFAAQRDGFYLAESAPTPPEFAAPAPALPREIQVPDSAYRALLIDNNPVSVLNIIDTLERNNAGRSLVPAAQYLRALSHDLLNNRSQARTAYFDLWTSSPASIWGQLAAQHLERR